MKVKDVMATQLAFCVPSDTVKKVAQLLNERDIGSLPVVADAQSQRLVGIITDRDLCCKVLAEGNDPSATRVNDVMTKDPATCKPEHDLNDCARLMRERHIRRIPVVDNGGRCVGMVAQADVARHAEPAAVKETIAEISRPARPVEGTRVVA